MLERRKARHKALQILYQQDITGESPASILENRSYSLEEGEPDEFAKRLVLGVESNQSRIDRVIQRISEHWVLSRMPVVDRNILRLAVYEMLYVDDIPHSVTINEAVEMAKVYGGEDSSKFVNGILGRVADDPGVLEDKEE